MRFRVRLLAGLLLLWPLPLAATEGVRPMPRPVDLAVVPAARWDFRKEGDVWTRDALKALRGHGAPLTRMDPADIRDWCPGYVGASDAARRAFWVGFLSALAKHESTWRPGAVGGGGLWYGLMQILPATARHYGCRAGSGAELKNGSANLSCAIRIMARTVPRDGVIHARQPRWSGVSADWGPMRSAGKRDEMATWLRGQEYCQMHVSPRPQPRPLSEGLPVVLPDTLVSGPGGSATRPVRRPDEVRLARVAQGAPVGPVPDDSVAVVAVD